MWKSVFFHIRAGMLSGPNALDNLRFFTANFNSVMVKFEVQILRVSEILTLGSVLSAGRVAFLPRRFLKWLEKFSIRFSATLDSNRCVGIFAGKFFDGFPGKMVLFTDVLIGQRINFAINKVNLSV